VIVDAGGGDVGVAEPFLNLGDVGLMIERVGGGRRAQRMGADRKAELRGIASHQLVDAVRSDRRFQPPGAVVADRPEQRAGLVEGVAGGVDPCRRLSGAAAFARVPKILHLQLAQLLAPQRVEQQRRQDGAVALALDRVLAGRCEQVARLMIADRRRLAFAAFGLRPLDAFDRVVGDGVLLAQILEQRGERRQPVADRRAAELAKVVRCIRWI
jgi:hypothetical protein